MKFLGISASLLLLPLSTLASPVAEPGMGAIPEGIQAREAVPLEAPTPAGEHKEQSRAELAGRDLFARAVVYCLIINVKATGYADCHSGPDGSYPVTYRANRDVRYSFNCSRIGSCVDGTCEWHRLFWNGGSCWVSGYYTENQCSFGTLGDCD